MTSVLTPASTDGPPSAAARRTLYAVKAPLPLIRAGKGASLTKPKQQRPGGRAAAQNGAVSVVYAHSRSPSRHADNVPLDSRVQEPAGQREQAAHLTLTSISASGQREPQPGPQRRRRAAVRARRCSPASVHPAVRRSPTDVRGQLVHHCSGRARAARLPEPVPSPGRGTRSRPQPSPPPCISFSVHRDSPGLTIAPPPPCR